MDNYFAEILSSLSHDDLKILGILNDEEANLKFKAIKKKTVGDISDLTEANFRKAIYRLEAIKFINVVTGQKEHKLFITDFGQRALFESLSKEEF